MVTIRTARISEIRAISKLRKKAADDLTRRFGYGHWSRISLFDTLRRALVGGTLFVIETRGKVVGTFTFDTRKAEAFVHLRSLSVAVEQQGRGIGRRAMAEIEKLARSCGLKAIRSDAYEGAAGAGAFYNKCGYTSVHHGVSNGVPLEYYEKVLD